MRELSSTYLTAAKATARYPDVRVSIGQLELTGSKEITSVHITRGSTSKPTGFVTAEAVGSSGTITIDRRTLASGAEANIESGENVVVEALFRSSTGSIIAYETIYTGIVVSYNKQDKTAGIISITDAMANTGIDYNPEILDYSEFGETYLSDIVSDAFDQAGLPGILDPQIELDIDPIVNEPPYKADEPVAEEMKGAPYSCREIIAAIAGMNLACFFIDAEGNPKLYQYGEPSTSAVTASILTELKTTDETFGLDRIKIFKTAEKMAKTAVNYRTLPYGPRLPEMTTLDSESVWYQQIQDKKNDILHWDWMTAVAKIQGVGEIEPGDRIQFTADNQVVKMFVTAIVYDFENAHFTETLYSFAQTEQEYKMSPPGQTNVSTKSSKDSTPQTYYSATDPANSKNVKAKDVWYQWESSSGKNLIAIKRRKLVSAATAQSDPVYEWEVVANISGGGGSGVGEWLDAAHTIEIFNMYADADAQHTKNSAVLPYDHVEGYNNHASWSVTSWTPTVGANHIQGANNTLINGEKCDIGGTGNTVTVSLLTLISFENVTVRGTNNTVTDSGGSFVNGDGCTVTNLPSGICTGYHHTVTNAPSGALICGSQATAGSTDLITAGAGVAGNVFKVSTSGDVTAHAYNTSSADFAEYFEWSDGNPEAADRMGLLVDQIGDKIAPAQNDEFFGAISARASVVGNAYEDYWHGKYITDVYGRIQYDKDGRALISPDFDPSREYVPRSQRPEWAVTGLTGRIIVRDDGSCIPGGYVSARQGVATFCYRRTAGRVLRRIDDRHIEILLK